MRWSGLHIEKSIFSKKASGFQASPAKRMTPTGSGLAHPANAGQAEGAGGVAGEPASVSEVAWLPVIEQYQGLLRKFVNPETTSVRQLAQEVKTTFERVFHGELEDTYQVLLVEGFAQEDAWAKANIMAGDSARKKAIDMFRPVAKDAGDSIPASPIDASNILALNIEFSTLCRSLRSHYRPRLTERSIQMRNALI